MSTLAPTASVYPSASYDGLLAILFSAPAGSVGKCHYVRPAKIGKGAEKAGISVTKSSIFAIRLGSDYESVVNRRLKAEGKEGDFTAQTLPWGQWAKGWEGKVIQHGGGVYIRIMGVKATPTVQWLLNGKECEYGDVEPYLLSEEKVEMMESKKKSTASHQGIDASDDAVMIKALKAECIHRISAGGQCWEK